MVKKTKKKYEVSVSETIYYQFEIEVDEDEDVEETWHEMNDNGDLDWDEANLMSDSNGCEVGYIEEIEEDE